MANHSKVINLQGALEHEHAFAAQYLTTTNEEGITLVQLGLESTKGAQLSDFLYAISGSLNGMSPEVSEYVFHKACEMGLNYSVQRMLENGANRFLEEEQSVVFVAKAALSENEPMLKLRTLQKFNVSQVCIYIICIKHVLNV